MMENELSREKEEELISETSTEPKAPEEPEPVLESPAPEEPPIPPEKPSEEPAPAPIEPAPAPEEPAPIEPPLAESLPPAKEESGKLPLCSLICGIVGLVGAWIPIVSWIAWILSLLAIIFGVKARKESGDKERNLATAGMVLGIVGLALTVIIILCTACVTAGIIAAGY